MRSADRPVEVEPEIDEESHPHRKATVRRHFELVVQKLLRCGEAVSESSIPRPVRRGSEPEAGEKLEMGGIVVCRARQTVVVEGLTIVRVGSRPQQRSRELDGARMWRLVGFATTEGAGERGERRDETSPQEPGVRIRARVEQHRSRCERRVKCLVEVEA